MKKAPFIQHRQDGMTLVELFIALALFAVVVVAIGAFESNIFIYNSEITGSYQTAQNAQVILKSVLTELRETSPGANGAYPLVSTGSTSLSFFSDSDNNGVAEEITYTLIGPVLYRAVIQPSGNPPVYNPAGQSTSTLIQNIHNTSTTTPIFQYYDTNYTGTSSPLVQPVTPTTVRLIKVNVTLDLDPNRSPLPVTYTIQASLRNLKTNL